MVEDAALHDVDPDALLHLWRQWLQEAEMIAAGKGTVQYSAANGSYINFKQLLVGSKALEITLEKCLAARLASSQEGELRRLLQTFLAPDLKPEVPAELAAAILRLAQAIPSGSPDILGAAERAVHAVIGSLKASPQAAQPGTGSHRQGAASVAKLDQKIAEKTQALNKDPSTKDHARIAGELLKLAEEKADMLAADGAASHSQRGDSAAALRSLEDLIELLTSQSKDSKAGDERRGQASGGQAYQKEANVLAQQAAEIATLIQNTENQLRSLKQRAAGVKQKQEALQQQMAAANGKSQKGGGKAPAQSLSPAVYEQQLAAARALQNVLHSSQQSGSPRKAAGGADAAAGDYLHAVETLLASNVKYQGEVYEKAKFTSERLLKAEKQAQHVTSLRLDEATVAGSKKQKEQCEKMMKDILKSAEDVHASSQSVLAGARRRKAPGVSMQTLRQADELTAEVARLYHAIVEESERKEPVRVKSSDLASALTGKDPVVPTPTAAAVGPVGPASGAGDKTALEARLAQLEAENKKKDAQIAALSAGDQPAPAASPRKGRQGKAEQHAQQAQHAQHGVGNGHIAAVHTTGNGNGVELSHEAGSGSSATGEWDVVVGRSNAGKAKQTSAHGSQAGSPGKLPPATANGEAGGLSSAVAPAMPRTTTSASGGARPKSGATAAAGGAAKTRPATTSKPPPHHAPVVPFATAAPVAAPLPRVFTPATVPTKSAWGAIAKPEYVPIGQMVASPTKAAEPAPEPETEDVEAA
ncbi:hypothetical protein WJX72_007410 [[Myrmecia] bisecta]|uniref:Uncharacterized protein n=1 Tax=[Myrmecia] bisecta TaxID=41462 RepID=A0AAW1PT50_9CHLO